MYHLDNESGVSTFALAPVKNTQRLWFTEGGHGNAISYPGADWFNMVQAELLSILDDAGIQPNKGQLNQISLAIRKLSENKVEDFSQNLKQADGYKLVGRCKSIAELRTIRPTEHGQRILVDAYYKGGTTGGGEFVADLQDMITPDDGGTCFVVEVGNAGRWKRVQTEITPEIFGAVGDKNTDDTQAFLKAITACRVLKQGFTATGKYKLTQPVDFREISVDALLSDILLEDNGQVIIGGNGNSSFNPDQKFGRILFGKIKVDPESYTRPSVKCIGSKGQTITVKYTDYMQLYMSTDPATYPRDASQAYSTFNINFVVKLEFATDPRFDNAVNVDGAGSANQWCNENVFNLNRCFALIIGGSYRHNCNYFVGGSFEGAKSFIDVQVGNKNRFVNTRLEGVSYVRFGEKTEGNILERSYFGSTAGMVLNVEDTGVMNRIETAVLEQSVKSRVLDINPFTPRWNNQPLPYLHRQVSRTIRATVNYGQLAESDWFEMVGNKDVLYFDFDNPLSRYQFKVYIHDDKGRKVDPASLSISSGFLKAVPNSHFGGTPVGGQPYGAHRLLLLSDKTYFVKVVVVASSNRLQGNSRYMRVDLYSNRATSVTDKIALPTTSKPTQYIGYQGDLIQYKTGKAYVDLHIQTNVSATSSGAITVNAGSLGSNTLKAGDLIGIESLNGDVFWGTVQSASGEQITVNDLPEWVTIGDDVYISRLLAV